MRFAIGLPNVGRFGDPGALLRLARMAEDSGWDAVYVWDHVLYHDPDWPVANPTVVAAAIAAATERIRFGVLMTALPRRRVHVVAREGATLAALSGARYTFGAGLGSMDREYTAFGEDPALPGRAARLDAGLADLRALWSGGSAFDGVRMRPTAAIPIWCAGRWPTRAGFRRAARYDGVMPTHRDFGKGRTMPPDVLAEIVRFIARERATLVEGAAPRGEAGAGRPGEAGPFDVALEGATDPATAAATVAPYGAAGLTWWVEALGWWRGDLDAARARIGAGPPRL